MLFSIIIILIHLFTGIILSVMETATILIIFVSSLLLGVTGYSIYTSFGPNAKVLADPFEEHED